VKFRRGWLGAVFLVLSGCAEQPKPLPHAVYVWQRQWTQAILQELERHRAQLAEIKLLMLERDGQGQWFVGKQRPTPLLAPEPPLWLVVRISGSRPDWQLDELIAQLEPLLSSREWRGVEIDFDCARSQLPAYTAKLRALRKRLPSALKLGVTALPDWLNAPQALRDLRAAVDQSVLQVHAVERPERGLFSAAAASAWLRAFAALSDAPFEIALPAYGLAARFDASGRPLAFAAENPSDGSGLTEFAVDPRTLADWIASVERAPPRSLTGWSWFRLPLPSDRRALSPSTFAALLKREPMHATLALNRVGTDLKISNQGLIDSPLPAIGIQGVQCSADASNGYLLTQENAERWRFDPPATLLKSGQTLNVGWLRCRDRPAMSLLE